MWASSSGVVLFYFIEEEAVATGGYCSELQRQIVAGQLDHRERH